MTSCRFRESIDEYLLGRLAEGAAARFEDHYFNCRDCFEEMRARAELLRVIKEKGEDIFERRPDRRAAAGGFWALFRPRPWLALAAGLAVIAALSAYFLLRTGQPSPPPAFTLGDDPTVRGMALEPVAPANEIGAIPEAFEWKPLSRKATYALSLFDEGLIWSDKTDGGRLVLPQDVRRRLRPGRTYTWEVKAYSPQGALISATRKISFKISGD